MKVSDFNYDLPKELIAQRPLKERDAARLMVLDRRTKHITEKVFRDITGYLNPGDCLVLNDTRVVPVRLYGRRKTGARVELFLLDFRPELPNATALVRPSKRIKQGEEIRMDGGRTAVVLGAAEAGRLVRFDGPVSEVLRQGHMPLPPYITRRDDAGDRDDYQTVYARRDGATAAPTAGLHFTHEVFGEIEKKKVTVVHVTLHTGYGSFAPVAAKNVEDHVMHTERFEISKAVADKINRAKASGGKIFAAGTTTTRVLEASAAETGKVVASSGETGLFIYPGYHFKVVDSIITNFHLPSSTLLMLVAAFAGRDFVLEAYKRAVEDQFRFFSYGDAMLVL